MAETKPSFVKDSPEPPQMVIGERFEAKIESIQKIDGEYGPQYRFDLMLPNGYKARDWISYYDYPTTNSRLGQLCTTIWSNLSKVNTPQEAMAAFKEYGRAFVECKGFRTVEGKTYPKLKVITTFIPTTIIQKGL